MPRAAAAALLLVAALGGWAQAATPRRAAKPETAPTSDYARDQITVVTEGRSRPLNPTATCYVWANAEGLGVGPDQLGGLHGVTLTLVVQPLPGETAKPFAQGLAEAKTAYPKASDWLMKTLAAQQAAIETACAGDHPEPVSVHRITRADMR